MRSAGIFIGIAFYILLSIVVVNVCFWPIVPVHIGRQIGALRPFADFSELLIVKRSKRLSTRVERERTTLRRIKQMNKRVVLGKYSAN